MHNGGRNTDTGFTIRPAQARELPAVLDLLKCRLTGFAVEMGRARLEPARAAGYTLIETVIAIVVAGILLSVAFARIGPALANARVRNAATVVATDLQYAQMLAVRQRRPVAVIVDNSVKSYIIRLRDTSVTFRNRFFGQDTEYLLDSLSANPASVVMYPNGVTTGTTTFTLRLSGFTRHVRLTRAGLVRILP